MRQLIVYTDLDGTLLDASYSADGSVAGLQRLQANGVPVVFCSAKTRAEQEPIREALGVDAPFIVENGSAVMLPGAEPHVLGLPAADVRKRLAHIQAATGLLLLGYAQLAASDVAALTGLKPDAAKLAKQRDYSETITTQVPASQQGMFVAACGREGLKAPSGGRFMTVTGANADKGAAVRWLTGHYRQQYGDVFTVGIGDSPNDAPMLAAVDRAYLVQRPDATWHDLALPHVRQLPAIGPAGFNLMVQELAAEGLIPL